MEKRNVYNGKKGNQKSKSNEKENNETRITETEITFRYAGSDNAVFTVGSAGYGRQS
jgi:hypothetical protein